MDAGKSQTPKAKDTDKALPVYKRIEQDLRERIRNGYWAPGANLPSRPRLAEQYNVGLATLEQAIVLLLNDGTLHAKNGRGTYVAHVPTSTHPIPVAPTPVLQESLNHSTGNTEVSPYVLHTPLLGIVSGELPIQQGQETIHNITRSSLDWENQVLRGLSGAFSAHGGAVTFLQRHDTQTWQPRISLRDALRHLLAEGVQAIAIANVNTVLKATDDVFATLNPMQIPVVFLSWEDIMGPLPQVIYDNTYAGYLAAHHLLQTGYKQLAFIGPVQDWWLERRIEGASMAVRAAHLPADVLTLYRQNDFPALRSKQFHFFESETAQHIGYECGHYFFSQTGPHWSQDNPPGIIAANDWVALGIIRAGQEHGKRVGTDYGLIGFDDVAAANEQGLTTLRPPMQEIGEEAARLLWRMLHHENTAQQIRLRSQLIVRTSTRRSRLPLASP